jgi:dihydrodipicolinate synthase/N-acetylneuraminate lyase
MNRRNFLQSGLFILGTRGTAGAAASAKPLRGIFPIAQTPFTSDDKLDLEDLAEEVRFIHRGKVHGFVWPQLASEWDTLTERERLDGAETVASTGKNLTPAIVLGVQAADNAAALRYARHAESVGADAIISLPPSWTTDPAAILDYYKQIGTATRLPIFVQAVGDMSVDLILRMYREVPNLRYIKDEAGSPLHRFAALNGETHGDLKIFTGGHGKTLIDEMIRGFSGTMPAASFADLYASAWNLWHAGHEREAVASFGVAAILINEISAYPDGMKFILCERGVFKTTRLRQNPKGQACLDENGKRALRRLLQLIKPRLTA